MKEGCGEHIGERSEGHSSCLLLTSRNNNNNSNNVSLLTSMSRVFPMSNYIISNKLCVYAIPLKSKARCKEIEGCRLTTTTMLLILSRICESSVTLKHVNDDFKIKFMRTMRRSRERYTWLQLKTDHVIQAIKEIHTISQCSCNPISWEKIRFSYFLQLLYNFREYIRPRNLPNVSLYSSKLSPLHS